MILLLFGGVEPPTRLEWATVKLVKRNMAQKIKNENIMYLEKRDYILLIQSHKNFKKSGVLLKKLKPETTLFLKKYIKRFNVNFNENVLRKDNGEPYSSPEQFGQRIRTLFKKYFNKRIGASMLRSIFLSHFYRKTPKLLEMQEVSNMMGHSIHTALSNYVKKN
jgi:hypothetical protein